MKGATNFTNCHKLMQDKFCLKCMNQNMFFFQLVSIRVPDSYRDGGK